MLACDDNSIQCQILLYYRCQLSISFIAFRFAKHHLKFTPTNQRIFSQPLSSNGAFLILIRSVIVTLSLPLIHATSFCTCFSFVFTQKDSVNDSMRERRKAGTRRYHFSCSLFYVFALSRCFYLKVSSSLLSRLFFSGYFFSLSKNTLQMYTSLQM